MINYIFFVTSHIIPFKLNPFQKLISLNILIELIYKNLIYRIIFDKFRDYLTDC